jgi:hypothetical protein
VETIAKLLKTDCISGDGEMQRVLYELSQGSQLINNLREIADLSSPTIPHIIKQPFPEALLSAVRAA